MQSIVNSHQGVYTGKYIYVPLSFKLGGEDTKANSGFIGTTKVDKVSNLL